MTTETLIGIGLLLARLILGLGVAAHGSQKLFGWFGGYGPQGTGQFLESLGFRPGVFFATMAGLSEFTGGLLTAAGLLNPVGPALIMIVMITAIGSAHRGKGFWTEKGGAELPLMNIAGALAIAFAGPGPYSVDAIAQIAIFSTPTAAWLVVLISWALAIVNLLLRRPPVSAPTS